MESVLGQLITVPGVVGGMIYDGQGALLSKTFPPLFDDSLLESAARVLADGTAGLETVTGRLGMLDMRFADARIVVRPMAGASLVLLCAAQTNLQLLNISTSIAVPKIERLVAALPPRARAAEPEAGAGLDVEDGAGPGDADEPQGSASPARGAQLPDEDPGELR